jgi:excisionase family DNA binding protein
MSVSAPPRPPETVSIKKAAERLDVHENTVRNWVDRNVLAGYKTPTGRRKVLLSDVERLQREMYGAPAAPQEMSGATPAPPQAGRLERSQL